MKSLWFICSYKKEYREILNAFYPKLSYNITIRISIWIQSNDLIGAIFFNYLVNVPRMSLSISLPPQTVPCHVYGGGGDAWVNHLPLAETRKKKYPVFEGGDWRQEFEHVGLRFLQDITPWRSLTGIWLDNSAPQISTRPCPARKQAL